MIHPEHSVKAMGMFDYFVPQPPVNCPLCGGPLSGWQGKNGKPLLRVWEQGSAFPVDEAVDDQWRLPPEELQQLRLPEKFEFYGGSCNCGYRFPLYFCGATKNGVWTSISPSPEVPRLKDVRDGHFQCRDCFDVVEAKDGWRLVLCPTCKTERWLEQEKPDGAAPRP